MISINWSTKVITIPQADLTLVSGSLYELDVDAFRLALKDIEDSVEGMAFPDTHRHNTEVVLSGVTYARTFEIINGYTVTFEDGNYTVRCAGANHNLADVKNVNSVSLIVGNSAGLIVGEGADPADIWDEVIEAGFTARQLLRLLAAVVQGDAVGLEGGVHAFKSIDGTKTRVAGTYSAGDREITSRDAS